VLPRALMPPRDILSSAARAPLVALILGALLLLSAEAFAQDPTFEMVRARAQDLARKDPLRRATDDLPEWLTKLDYDGYRHIHFRPETALWSGEDIPFTLEFLHRGYLFKERVPIHAIEDGQTHELRFSPAQFDYGSDPKHSVPPDLGYSGFAVRDRTLPAERAPGAAPQIAAFQGASYFRILGRGQVYGASARGLAIDTASDKGEEFPAFVEFWIEKPQTASRSLTLCALLDSPSATGAFRFVITPGDVTSADVTARIYPRRAIEKLGLAPLTSMFLFGEAGRREIRDWRQEVHDSDGLAIESGDHTWTWRTLENPQRTHRITRFAQENPAGFGLLQRDRAFTSYQDLESRFESRPSWWVAPRTPFGKGAIELVEIPNNAEWNENIVCYWVPEKPAEKGAEIALDYTLSAFLDDPAHAAPARAVSTRTGAAQDAQLFVVDFTGSGLDEPGLVADIAPSHGALRNVVLRRNEAIGGQRVSFELADAGAEPLEIRVTLRRDGRAVSETLVMPWTRS
jgi:glucans biosynthesis protein